jgi:D-glycero-D-manno-heptose 1,7-bisphosphate phosphatase
MSQEEKRRAFFLDRDGTVADEVGYVNHLSRFRLYPWAVEAIRRIHAARMAAVVVTNQAGVARGYFPEELIKEVNQKMQQELTIPPWACRPTSSSAAAANPCPV